MSKNPLNRIAKLALLVAAAGSASSCIKPDPFANLSCPSIQVLADARVMTKFKPGQGRDITDIEYEGRIAKVDYTCNENESRGYVQTNLTIRTEFVMGMGAPVRNPEFPIFVAVSEGERRVIEKTSHVVKAKFKENRRITQSTTVVRRIRVPMDGNVPVEYHNVIVGFQLSPAQLAYNRTKQDS